ncbi:sodium-translocating pyrophosphatase [Candidatus Woesearchaeota archaeon]|nr:sodium-translocating pyrophosphatase [Candidatus Woesearchaeota archaeon]
MSGITGTQEFFIGFILLLVAITSGFVVYLVKYLLKCDTGTKKMQEISGAITEGANAFLKRQNTTIALIGVIVTAIIFGLYYMTGQFDLGLKTAIAFVLGALCSGLAGYIGMWISIRANVRTASAARKSINEALKISMYGGSISGLVIVMMSLVGIVGLYIIYGHNPTETPFILVGYGFGASFVALFAQLGGGIYTKAADLGADLVGKVEAGIPEDDPRNPAVIADLVGDNVGDCAGRGADLFESTAAENIGAMILGVAITLVTNNIAWVLFPLVMRAVGLLATIIGIMFVKMKNEDEDPMKALDRGYLITDAVGAVAFFFITRMFLGEHWFWFFIAGIIGIITNILLVKITQYYTTHLYRPVKTIAKSSVSGAATNIISGLAVAFESTLAPILSITAALILAFICGVKGTPAGMNPIIFGLYATAIATMGKLICAAYILAMDTLGPIVDNAGGIVEMSGETHHVRKKTDKLDSLGNTTKALTKGYAIGTAVLATFLLTAAYMENVAKLTGKAFDAINIANVNVFGGAMLGGVLIFLFSGLTLMAVSKAAQYIIEEVRRQFKDKAILSGKKKPDYARCVDITTKGSLKQMILPGVVVIVFPILTGMVLKAEAMGAFLMVATIVGVLVATLMNNGGGAWDNAKKYIESGEHGGKGTGAHAAAIIGDTIGDPFKDTVGPSLHVVIKLLTTITLVLAPLFI